MEAESAAGQGNMKRMHDITRTMSEKRSRPSKPVKNKEGIAITEEQEQRARWVEHFWDILNRPPRTGMPNITATEGLLLNVIVNPPSKAEIEQALKQSKNGKAAGPDGIPPEALKVAQKLQQPCYTRFVFRSGKLREFYPNGRLAILSSCLKRGS